MTPVDLLLTLPCTITRVTWSDPDPFGDRTRMGVPTDTVCDIQQSTTAEDRDGGVVVVTGWNGYFPAGTDIQAGDEVAAQGKTFTVDGQPWPVRDPLLDQVSHVQVRLQEVQ